MEFRLLKRLDFEELKFTLYFLGYEVNRQINCKKSSDHAIVDMSNFLSLDQCRKYTCTFCFVYISVYMLDNILLDA